MASLERAHLVDRYAGALLVAWFASAGSALLLAMIWAELTTVAHAR